MSQATIPILLKRYENQLLAQVISILIGIVLISLLAQIAFPLPQTPVPVTGQTFGVALVALLWGRSVGFTIMGLYLLLGAFGVPVFSFGRSGWQWGPNIGYLMGEWAASAVMGYLADCGWTR